MIATKFGKAFCMISCCPNLIENKTLQIQLINFTQGTGSSPILPFAYLNVTFSRLGGSGKTQALSEHVISAGPVAGHEQARAVFLSDEKRRKEIPR